MNTKKDLGECLAKIDTDVKQFFKTNKTMHKQMNSLNKYNKTLYKLDNKTI